MSGAMKYTDDQLALLAKMASEGATAAAMAEAVGRSTRSIHDLGRQGRLQYARAVLPAVIPDNFAEQWQEKSRVALAKHYGHGPNTIMAWEKRLGLNRPSSWRSPDHRRKPRAPRVRQPRPLAAPKAERAKRLPDVTPIGRAASTAPVDTYQRDMSPAGQAADYLRQFGPVYRCNNTGRAVDAIVSGRANPEATHWRVGSAVVTSNELIERAASKRRREAERRAA